MLKQTIAVVLNLKEGQKPYKFLEGGETYEVFKFFFEDMGYQVEKIMDVVEDG